MVLFVGGGLPAKLSSYEVFFLCLWLIFLWSFLPVRLSSCKVIFMWYHLPVCFFSWHFLVRSSFCEVILLSGHPPVWSSSCEVVFLRGFLPLRLCSSEVAFRSNFYVIATPLIFQCWPSFGLTNEYKICFWSQQNISWIWKNTPIQFKELFFSPIRTNMAEGRPKLKNQWGSNKI